MARTNMAWIAKKKAAQQKSAKLRLWSKKFEYPKRNLSLDEAIATWAIWWQENPRGNTFHWFMRGRKICRETRLRVDSDGYRLVRLPSGWVDFVTVMQSWRTRKKLVKKLSSGSVVRK